MQYFLFLFFFPSQIKIEVKKKDKTKKRKFKTKTSSYSGSFDSCSRVCSLSQEGTGCRSRMQSCLVWFYSSFLPAVVASFSLCFFWVKLVWMVLTAWVYWFEYYVRWGWGIEVSGPHRGGRDEYLLGLQDCWGLRENLYSSCEVARVLVVGFFKLIWAGFVGFILI